MMTRIIRFVESEDEDSVVNLLALISSGLQISRFCTWKIVMLSSNSRSQVIIVFASTG